MTIGLMYLSPACRQVQTTVNYTTVRICLWYVFLKQAYRPPDRRDETYAGRVGGTAIYYTASLINTKTKI